MSANANWQQETNALRERAEAERDRAVEALRLLADQMDEHITPGRSLYAKHLGCSACGRATELARAVLAELGESK